jgi:hypothetical protein
VTFLGTWCILRCMGNPAGVKRNFDGLEKFHTIPHFY